MRLELTGRNIEITPGLRQLINRKLSKLGRVLNDSMLSAQVVLTLEKYRHVAEVTVHARGDHMLRGIGNANAWQPALTEALDKISHQALKLKTKWEKRKRRAISARVLPAEAAAPEAPPAPTGRLVRASRYPVKPMSVEDAALKVESGKEAFLVFRNAATDTVNIVYRRKDGQLGLIEPEA
jgi:putative sigma-54 modulation protein